MRKMSERRKIELRGRM